MRHFWRFSNNVRTQFCWRFRTTFFSTFRDLRAPHFGIFLQSDKGNAGRLLPGIFHLFVNLSPSFVIQKLCLKRPGFFPSYHVDTSLPSAVCVTSTPCRHCKNSLETSSLCPPKGQLQSQWSFCDSHSFIILKSSNKEIDM